MNEYEFKKRKLKNNPATWLVTGVAGFIGSNLLETLLKLNQRVIGLDNFITGHRRNLEDVKKSVSHDQWQLFSLIEGDVRSLEDCTRACKDVHYVLHQAALGSVPRSIENPIASNQHNIDGFLNILHAAKDANVKRLVYASSSSTYGDHEALPKSENKIGNPLSPYAVTKLVNELYAQVFMRCYGLETIGLRYFNVFGRRQDPNGPYAAVIPKWIAAMLDEDVIHINGDGETSRDFCYVDNAVQANLLAALADSKCASAEVYNVAVGQRTTLNELYTIIRQSIQTQLPDQRIGEPVYRDFRKGDVRHSLAEITKAKSLLGYQPTHGLEEAMTWYLQNHKS